VGADSLVPALVALLSQADVQPRRLVLLGLGSPTASAVARQQLALAVLLAAELPLDGTCKELLFVRIFSSADKCFVRKAR
jgi:hypothetical protein